MRDGVDLQKAAETYHDAAALLVDTYHPQVAGGSGEVFDWDRVPADLGVPVMCYGLRVDFRGELFRGSAALLALADEMREARTICFCGKKATMVVRVDDEQAVRVRVAAERGEHVGQAGARFQRDCPVGRRRLVRDTVPHRQHNVASGALDTGKRAPAHRGPSLGPRRRRPGSLARA